MRDMSWNRGYAFVLGAVYLVVGLAGFAVTEGLDFTAAEGEPLLGFDVNPLHNVVHLGLGALWLLAAAMGLAAARGMNIGLGTVLLAVGIVGFFVTGEPDLNILALDTADNWLHIVTGGLALLIGVAEPRQRAVVTERRRETRAAA